MGFQAGHALAPDARRMDHTAWQLQAVPGVGLDLALQFRQQPGDRSTHHVDDLIIGMRMGCTLDSVQPPFENITGPAEKRARFNLEFFRCRRP